VHWQEATVITDASSFDVHVGFIGVGHMGRPMVERMVAAGVPTEVYVRRSDLRDELVSTGVAVATSASDLAARSDVVILCCFNDAQVREVMLDDGVLSAMRSGSIVVSHVTGSPALSRDLQAAAPEGVTVLDVPISGTDDHIRRGQLTLMVGGDVAALDRIRSVLATYGNPILHVGGLGGGSFAINLFQHMAPESVAGGARHYLAKDVSTIRAVAGEQGIELGLLGELATWVFE
jgi:3-hydroxyisobutyrate dehydrogenase